MLVETIQTNAMLLPRIGQIRPMFVMWLTNCFKLITNNYSPELFTKKEKLKISNTSTSCRWSEVLFNAGLEGWTLDFFTWVCFHVLEPVFFLMTDYQNQK